MADVRPFKGIEYNTGIVGDHSKVVAPPFDVISPEMRAALHGRHEANVVRLILADESKLHPGAVDKYDSARLYLEEWFRSGTLIQSDDPAVYLLAQEFEFDGTKYTRWGFIGAVKLEDYNAGVVIPHEDTLDKPKADRLKLITACEANLSPVFACYFDSDGKIAKAMEGASDTEPLFEARMEDLGISRVWRITDPVRLGRLSEAMKDRQLFIADGHHRYESALNYRNLMREKNPGVSDAPWERVMIYMSDFEDPALLALPIHRAIKHLKGWTPGEFMERLKASFTVQKLDVDLTDSPQSGRESLIREMAESGGKCIGMVLRDDPFPYLICPTEEAMQGIDNIPEPLKELDIIQLHRLALGDVLEIREKDLRDGEVIVYDHGFGTVFDMVRSGGWAAAFFLNRLKVGQIRRVCSAGLRMHQKSTYFYPKIPSGLVFHRLR